MNAFIYALNDPINGRVCYIGKTDNPEQRLRHHLKPSRLLAETPKNTWIVALLEEGLKPTITILDTVPKANWQWFERFWIEQYRLWGYELTNATAGGFGTAGFMHSAATKAKMRTSGKGKRLSDETKARLSASAKGKPRSKVTCTRCGATGGISNMKRYHFENCKVVGGVQY